MTKYVAMAHQKESLKFFAKTKRVFDMSDPGTGKTFVEIMDFAARRRKKGGKALIFAPKSLLKTAWYNDFRKFAPDMKVSLAYAENREAAFKENADVYVTNVDASKWVATRPKKFFEGFDTLILDESGQYKHHTSARSRALAKIVKYFEWRRAMNGTPNPNGICDLWHQYFLLDDGKRLGKSFFGFRANCCIPKQVGPSTNMVKWVDREGIETIVTELVKDITIRHVFEECLDIPKNHLYSLKTPLAPKHMKQYRAMEATSLLALNNTTVTAVHGGALAQKLMQISSGAVYNDNGGYTRVGTERYELILDLVQARSHCVVFYMWEHQLEEIVQEAEKRSVSFVVWDADRPEIEEEFQSGMYQMFLAHPQSAAYGLTLTKGVATIYASPTYNLDHFLQSKKRIHRIGQKHKTETIVIVGEDTADEHVFEIMQHKNGRLEELYACLKEARA